MADYSYMAYLDILGYKQLIDSDIRLGTQTFKEKMISSFKVFDNVNSAKFTRRVISDSIFISCSEREAVFELLKLLREVFCAFLDHGLLIRGGVSYGEHFQNETITYSPVLTKSYLLESKTAIFPRIMVDRNICDMFPSLYEESFILRTGDSFFLNVLSQETALESLAKSYELYQSQIDQIMISEEVRSKHKWLQDYINDFCEAHTIDTSGIGRYIKTYDA